VEATLLALRRRPEAGSLRLDLRALSG